MKWPRVRRVLKWLGVGLLLVALVLAWLTRTHPLEFHPGNGVQIGIGRLSVRVLWTSYGGTIAWDVLSGPLPSCAIRANMFHISFPFWLGMMAIVLLTSILFYLDRRPPKGRCQTCEYDLTGNTSGVCPECGERI